MRKVFERFTEDFIDVIGVLILGLGSSDPR